MRLLLKKADDESDKDDDNGELAEDFEALLVRDDFGVFGCTASTAVPFLHILATALGAKGKACLRVMNRTRCRNSNRDGP